MFAGLPVQSGYGGAELAQSCCVTATRNHFNQAIGEIAGLMRSWSTAAVNQLLGDVLIGRAKMDLLFPCSGNCQTGGRQVSITAGDSG